MCFLTHLPAQDPAQTDNRWISGHDPRNAIDYIVIDSIVLDCIGQVMRRTRKSASILHLTAHDARSCVYYPA
jgi:hypothetical protein